MTGAIDLRSDTVSKPTEGMRRAIAAAEVGDDVFGDDPTVNRLEEMAASLSGKEAALFVASGTMANLVAVMTHVRPGDEILLGDQSHIFNYEVAGTARVALAQAHALSNLPDGGLDPAEVRAAIRPPNLHTPRTSLLCIENTHNRCGGAAIPVGHIDELAAIAHGEGLRVHLDGARLFNAQVALGIPAARIARECDTVSFCFSKGLGCPVGSVLCGPAGFIAEARRNRKLLGGGMRQAGILAAAAVYALENNVERLAEDHANARRLAKGLRGLGPFAPNEPETNIVVADVLEGSLEGWLRAFRDAGVLAVAFGPRRLRMVTHINIGAGDIEEALRRVERVAAASPA
ncbi:MAG: low-specificity L-threonine aldolase [Chloroflexi bacterium CFX7]|nr:low-specificity L-threonine aldolase [Chloroflexi bacterium CFX7]RIL04300.1 MAG: low-specificity L-threonine aldolase [bacterium]